LTALPTRNLAIPSFVPRGCGTNGFTFDATARTAGMSFDMNRVLVQNETSSAVVPFN
jgi:hypothetical protein